MDVEDLGQTRSGDLTLPQQQNLDCLKAFLVAAGGLCHSADVGWFPVA